MDTEEAILRLSANGTSFSDEQLMILRTSGGIDLLAIAGSGKTFTLRHLIAKRLMTGEIADASKVLSTTFSKAGAEELQKGLSELLALHRLPSVHVTTLHAACFDVLRQFGVVPSKVLSEGEALELLRAAAKDFGYGRISQDDLMTLMNLISVQYNALMSDDELVQSNKWTLEMPLATYVQIREQFQTLKSNIGAIDFDDMQRYVYDWLCVSKYTPVIQWCQDRWKYLFIDEFQDTNPVQIAIITAILGDDRPSDRLVVVGDDDQCIYEWRGTDPRILINICGRFDLTKRYLSTNYRCPSEIVEKAGNCVVNMGEREKKTMQANREGGHIELLNLTKMYNKVKQSDEPDSEVVSENSKIWRNPICKGSQAITDKVVALLMGEQGACFEKSICVLSRENATMRILSNMLYSSGVAVKGQNSMYISSAREWGTLKKMLKILDTSSMVADVDDILWQIIPSASINFGKLIGSIIMEAGCSLDWALERLMIECYNDSVYKYTTNRQLIAGESNSKGSGLVSIKTIECAKYEISKGIEAESLVEVINALRLADKTSGLIRLINRWKIASAFLYKTNAKLRMFDAYVEYFAHLVKLYGYQGIDKFMQSTEQFERGRFNVDKRVELRTIHGAKGGEWNTVFILMDDNIEFPSLEAIKLMQSRNIAPETINRYIDSERRLHYVAQTRASNTLYIVSEAENTSIFVLESIKHSGGNKCIFDRADSLSFRSNGDAMDALQCIS